MKYLTFVIGLVCCYQLASAQSNPTGTATHNPPPSVAHLEIAPPDPVPLISLKDIPSYNGKLVKIIGVVAAHKVLDTVELLAVGGTYPNQALTVVLHGKALDAFKTLDIDGKTIWVYGVSWADDQNKDPQMLIGDPNMISIVKKRE